MHIPRGLLLLTWSRWIVGVRREPTLPFALVPDRGVRRGLNTLI